MQHKQIIDILYNSSSLRDEIGTCPNIDVEINITDKLPFSIRPYPVKEEDKNSLDRKNDKIMLLRYIKGRYFSAYSSPIMLISR